MDAEATASDAPVGSLGGRGVKKPRVPRKGHGDRTPVEEVDRECVIGHAYILHFSPAPGMSS